MYAEQRAPAGADLSSSIGQASHYRMVRARLRGNPEPSEQTVRLAPRPKPPRARDYIFVQLDPLDASPTLLRLRWRDIVCEVCAKHGVSVLDVMGSYRDRRIVHARQEAMYRLRHETTMSYPEIGRRLGDKDHTTVMHGEAKHAERMESAAQ